MRWDANLIANTVYEYVTAHNISIVRVLRNMGPLIAEISPSPSVDLDL